MSSIPAPVPQDEEGRLEALRCYQILDTPAEAIYDDIAALVANICDVPMAYISLIDRERQWFKSAVGMEPGTSAPREIAFCAQTIQFDDILLVPDASKDPRFANHPYVANPPHFRFYAGVPLTTPDGFRIGTLCAADFQPRDLNEDQLDALRKLAAQVVANLELRKSLAETERARKALAEEVRYRTTVEAAKRTADEFMRASIDALADHIAIIDYEGRIVHVNRSWQEFAAGNRAEDSMILQTLGMNYYEVCQRAAESGAEEAKAVEQALRAVLSESEQEAVQIEYPCHAPHERRWFVVSVTGFGSGIERYAVVAHRNVTERKLAQEELHSLNQTLEQRVAERTYDLEQAYRSLHASEERMRSLFENAAIGIAVCASDGTILNVNDAALKMSQMSRDDVIGASFFEFGHADDRDKVRREFLRIASGSAATVDVDARSGGRSAVLGAWRRISLLGVHGAGSETTQVMVLIQNLDERHELESQRDLFFERTRDLLVIASLDGQLHLPNPACTKVLGYADEQLCELNFFDLVHPDDLEETRARLKKIGAGEYVHRIDARMRTKAGHYRDISWHASSWTEPGKVLAVGRDMTSIRSAQRELRARSTMLQRAEQMAQMGSWQYVFANNSVHCSDGLQAIACREGDSADVSIDELLGFVIKDDADLLRTSIRNVAKTGIPERIECRIRRPSGELRIVQTSIDARRNSKGDVDGVIGACLDITDMNETLERLRFSEHQLRSLTRKLEQVREDERAAISREVHDELGQILTALKIDLTLLRRDAADDEAPLGREDITVALQSMEELVDSTINSVRAIATQLRPEVLDAFGLVSAIEWHASEFEQRTQIRCRVDAKNEQTELDSDTRTALFRIVQEAMTNAARHAGAKEVLVSIRQHRDRLQLQVRDNGRGVNLEDIAGTNSLGVLGMRERATMVGAEFDIRGEPGRGTTVTVELPLQGNRSKQNGSTRTVA